MTDMEKLEQLKKLCQEKQEHLKKVREQLDALQAEAEQEANQESEEMLKEADLICEVYEKFNDCMGDEAALDLTKQMFGFC